MNAVISRNIAGRFSLNSRIVKAYAFTRAGVQIFGFYHEGVGGKRGRYIGTYSTATGWIYSPSCDIRAKIETTFQDIFDAAIAAYS